MHRQTDDRIRHLVRIGQIIRAGTLQSAIGREFADQRIEVSAPQDILRFHLEVELVACHAVLLCINEDGEIAVVVLHPRHVIHKGDALYGTQGLAILYSHLVSCLYCCINLTKVQDAVGRTHLVNLAVDSRSDHFCLASETEVLQVVYPFLCLLIVHHQCTALDGVVHFCRMEAEGAHVACIQDALSIYLHTEGMGGIVDDLEPVFVGYGLDAICLARLAIDMHRHDGCGLGSDGRFYLVRVYVPGCRVYVHKHGLDAVPPEGVGCGNETVGSRDDFSCDAQRLQCRDEGERSVCEEADEGNFQILCKFLF